MKFFIVTNNPKVLADFGADYEVDYQDLSFHDTLCKVRNFIHKGHKLLTHPLSGSVKPNETPYKSILVEKIASTMNLDDLGIIENSIVTCDKFKEKFLDMPQSMREDFQLIDSTLIKSALDSIPTM